jgi:hypothetical protein
MKDNYYITRKILARIRRGTVKSPAFAGDFLDLGSRTAVDQALSRLVQRGHLRRVGRGLYALSLISRLTGTEITPPPDTVARSLARKLGLRILPSPAYAANLLGLSTQVPAKIIYMTDGRARTVKIGAVSVIFRHGSPKTMAVLGPVAPLVFQALRYLGREGVSQTHIACLRRLLKKKDKKELMRNLRYAPAWMKHVLLKITETIAQGE